MHALLGSFNSGNWSDSKVLGSTGTKLLCYHEGSGCKNLVVYVCLNAVLVEFSLTKGIYGRGLIRTRLGYHEESGCSSPGDNI